MKLNILNIKVDYYLQSKYCVYLREEMFGIYCQILQILTTIVIYLLVIYWYTKLLNYIIIIQKLIMFTGFK